MRVLRTLGKITKIYKGCEQMLILIAKDTTCKIKMEQPHKVFVIKVQDENVISVQMAHTNQLEKHLTSRRSVAEELKQNITDKERNS